MKKILLIILVFGIATRVNADVTEIHNGTVFGTDQTIGDVDWSNPSNIQLKDGGYAVTNINANSAGSFYLYATTFGFLPSIPAGSIIKGIQTYITHNSTKDNANDYLTDLSLIPIKNNTLLLVPDSIDHRDAITHWDISDVTVTYGSSRDLWGTTWTRTQIGGAFGMALSVQGNILSNATGSVDWIGTRIFFEPPPISNIIVSNMSNITIGSTNDQGGVVIQ